MRRLLTFALLTLLFLLPFSSHAIRVQISDVPVVVKTIVGTVNALSFATPVAVDMDIATVFTLTVTGTVTLNASNGTAGQWVYFVLTDDGTGGFVVTFGTAFDSVGTLTTVASEIHVLIFVYDGTAWRELSRSPTGLFSALTLLGDLTINSIDPAIILDGSTASDTDFWLGVTADEDGNDDDKFQIGDGTVKGTNPFLTILTNGDTYLHRLNIDNAVIEDNGGVYAELDGAALAFTGGDILDIGTNDVSVSAWIRTTSSASMLAVGKLQGGTGDQYGIRLGSGIVTGYIANGASEIGIASTNTVDDGFWHHIAVTFDRSGNAQTFIDGVADGAAVDISSMVADDIDSARAFTVGVRNVSGASYDQYLNGDIRDVRIYIAAGAYWSPANIAAQVATPMDNSVGGTNTSSWYLNETKGVTAINDDTGAIDLTFLGGVTTNYGTHSRVASGGMVRSDFLGLLTTTDEPILESLTIEDDIALNSVSAGAGAGLSNRIIVTNPMMVYMPGAYHREFDDKWQIKGTTGADRYTLQTPARLLVDVDDTMYLISSQTDLDLSAAATWDTQAPTDYTVAANRAGVDFYIYAIQQAGTTPLLEVSDNSSAPDGYTTADSRRVGGFHGLCVAVGTIGGHALTDFVAGDILPGSVWDYDHRPVSEPEGMVFSEGADLWVDIYLASGTGASTLSAYGGTISDTRNWIDFVDDGGAVKKRLLRDREFQIIASGSNEETNIAGSADPGTTGGHSDTAGRRMISDIGVEDACGVMWQWLDEQSYRYDGGDHTHTSTITHKAGPTGGVVHKDQAETTFNATLGSSADETVNTSSVDPAPAFGYYNLPGTKGSLYRQGTNGDVKLMAGANWPGGNTSGSRARDASSFRWRAFSGIGGRFAAESR